MYESAGIFLNNTNNNIKLDVNLSNINLLFEHFDKIFVIDNNKNFNDNIKSNFNNNNNKILFFNVDFEDEIEKIIYLFDKFYNFNSITFIDDNFILLNDLKDYFNYVKNTNYNIYSYTDSTEDFYHLQTNIFSIKKDLYKNFYELCNNTLKTRGNINKKIYKNNFNKGLTNLEINKGVFIKVAYMEINYGKNIYSEYNNYYEELLKNNILQIISYNLIKYFDNKFNNQNFVYKKIPDNFEIKIYKSYDDLKEFDEGFLKNHFIEHGQFECRKFSLDNTILPKILYEKINNLKLIKYFDFPENFDFNIYKYKNDDLNILNKLQLKKHWFEYGIYEDRIIY